MNEILLSVFILSFVVDAVYNLFWLISYPELYWAVLSFRVNDFTFSLLHWLFNLLPFISTFVVWVMLS